MTVEHLGPTGSEELQDALRELLEMARRSVEAYRLAEEVAPDHRLCTATEALRLRHERHIEELAAVLAELGGRAVAATDAASDAGPVGEAMLSGKLTGAAMLNALQQAEAELCTAYERHARRGYLEPIQAVLVRHRLEEEAHEAWLHERELWLSTAAGIASDEHVDSAAPSAPSRQADGALDGTLAPAADAPVDAGAGAPTLDIAAQASPWAAQSRDREEEAV